jgi:hypothetical protein
MSNRVVQKGSVNLNATQAPGLLVIESLNSGAISGVATNLVGAIGTATYGPKNSPTLVDDIDDFIFNFGTPATNKYDLGTFVNAAGLQGNVIDFYCVRVTDNTDVAALTRLSDSQSLAGCGAILSAKYTGTTGNTFQAKVVAGSVSGTYTLVIGRPGYVSETFANISGSGATFWTNLINAVNSGQSGLRGPSQLVVASTSDKVNAVTITAGGSAYTSATVSASGGGGTGFAATATVASGAVTAITITNRGSGYSSAPTLTISGDGTGATATASLVSTSAPATPTNAYTFSGGTDGISGVTGTTLLGSDSSTRTGMYSLRNTNVSLFALVDCDDTTTFSDQLSFAQQTAAQAIFTGPSGQTAAQAISAKQGLGIDDPGFIYLVGDYCNYLDTYNNAQVRLITQQGFYAGKEGNLSPEQDPLNKPILGILSTQLSSQNRIYSDAELTQFMENGIEVISIPSPGGNYFACQTGKAGSTDLTINDVYIQRMANFLALSLSKSGVLGAYIGQLQTPSVRTSARNAISSFLQDLVGQGQIEAFSVVLDDSNNPQNRVRLGFMTADVSVQLFNAIITFIINLDVGTASIQSVQPTA